MSNTLNDVRFALKQKAVQAAYRMDQTWQAELRTTAPHKSYNLRNNTTVTHKQSRDRIVWTAEVDTDYAAPVAFGARPHVITARRASALRFYWPKAGKVVYFRQVNHPGNQPNPWWKRSLEHAPARLQRIWEET